MLKLYYISDRSLTPSLPPSLPIIEAVRAGVNMVQVREKDLGAREVLRIAREVTAAAEGTGVEVYVNSRFDIARAAGAGGVHLPADGLRASDVRRAVSHRTEIGVSTHSVEEAREAESQGAGFITFGPVFETPSKRRFGPPLGLRALHGVLAAVRLPVFALGGIHPGNASQVLDLPVSGIAVISAIALAPDRARAVGEFRAIARRVRGGEE